MVTDAEHQEVAQERAAEELAKTSLEALKSLLDLVILNRSKRKAKNIVMNSVQFIISVISLLYQVGADGRIIAAEAVGLGIFVILCAVILITFVMCHARWWLSPDHKTKMDVEEAYKATNDKPIIDGILEIELARKFGCQWICYGAWMVFVVVLALLVHTLIFSYDSGPYVFPSLLAVMTAYQMTSDFCEYWVHTRPENSE